ncbi:esterase/lipase family protein [Paracoccus sulfuroxidans]|uniref:Alpha/beta hydrolase family protein n=1 Tax=Paracoccus sulfuroxidans TaxID=384678 RepID=A0A562N7N9_9RHOB|nr:alpha/beta fold hydrolase [Paracoccus sulfuroxidans]TWI28185.1 alpha/beta hydrolase family protein [Paracoccus sulfuroxidans]
MLKSLIASSAIVFAAAVLGGASAEPAGARNIVLVHGAWVDGSGWQGVYDQLKSKGYNVTIVQHPTASLDEDVAYVRRALALQDGPTVLVGHSYGGVILSQVGNDPKVKSLVYVTAFAPDAGESVLDLIADLPEGVPVPPILPPRRKSRNRPGRPSPATI